MVWFCYFHVRKWIECSPRGINWPKTKRTVRKPFSNRFSQLCPSTNAQIQHRYVTLYNWMDNMGWLKLRRKCFPSNAHTRLAATNWIAFAFKPWRVSSKCPHWQIITNNRYWKTKHFSNVLMYYACASVVMAHLLQSIVAFLMSVLSTALRWCIRFGRTFDCIHLLLPNWRCSVHERWWMLNIRMCTNARAFRQWFGKSFEPNEHFSNLLVCNWFFHCKNIYTMCVESTMGLRRWR